MPGNNYFQFKQFRINQKKSAMRVGTDGVLLGAWANSEGAKTILDIGTGTGVIALMLAQRSDAEITAIEIEQQAAEEAASNAGNSPWSNHINIIHDSFQNFSSNFSKTFDLIVSNPPFFINSIRSTNINLAVARHSDKLSLYDLLKGSEKLLNKNGMLAVVLPVQTAEICVKLAEKYGFYLFRLTEVKPAEGKPTNRHLMEFSRIKWDLQKDSITNRNAANNNYTEEYKRLTRDFYLDF